MRSRNIKPAFFLNEDLGELSLAERLLFIGLWCYADRDGFFENRPKRIAAEIFPYDRSIGYVDIEKMLCNLMSLHLITCNDAYGHVCNFAKHQRPHPHEAKSSVPEEAQNILLNQCHDMSLHVTQCTSDIINEDTRNDDIRKEDTAAEKTTACPHFEIVNLFNEILSPSLAAVKPSLWNGTRKKNLSARWKEDQSRQEVEWWKDFFLSVKSTPFLLGKNDRGWSADMGWLLKPDNMVKVLEGTYLKTKVPDNLRAQPKMSARQSYMQDIAYANKQLEEAENGNNTGAGQKSPFLLSGPLP